MILDFIKAFSEEIKNVPDGFYDTFQYTTTGKNHTHPRTLGYITKALWNLENVSDVYIDYRINVDNGKTKFQPDIFSCDGKGKPLLVIDYESPNSSDARIPSKDVKPYLKWNPQVPYIIITTLPKRHSPSWQLRYTDATNKFHKDNNEDIRKNPFEYWYNFYKNKLQKCEAEMKSVYFININGKETSLERLFLSKLTVTAPMAQNGEKKYSSFPEVIIHNVSMEHK